MAGRKTRKKTDDEDDDSVVVDPLATAEWVLIMQATSPEQKDEIAGLLERHNLSTYDGFAGFCTSVMSLAAQGRIPLPLLPEMRKWAELAFTALTYATDKYNKGPQQQSNIVALVQQAAAGARAQTADRQFVPDFSRKTPERPALPEFIDSNEVSPEREKVTVEAPREPARPSSPVPALPGMRIG